MSAVAKPRMTVEEFLAWGEGRDDRWELHDGELVAMSPERLSHLKTKFSAAMALKNAVDKAKLPCSVLPDGATVRINSRTAFEPDALVRCGGELPPDAIEIPDPLIVVEVLSPGTEARDRGAKLEGYFSLPSIIHYLILDPDNRKAVHHKRGRGDVIETRILGDGMLLLDPPGFEVALSDMFPTP